MDSFNREAFYTAVYDIVVQIPAGRACSYGAIAKAIGYPQHSRMVGQAMKTCPKDLPAYRVVNNQGILSGKDCFEYPEKMQQLLEAEGIQISNNRIKDWKKVFWNPIDEITL